MEISLSKINSRTAGFNESEILVLKKYKEIDEIFKKFPYNGKFQEEKIITSKKCRDFFSSSIKMNEKDWEILTMIRLFDEQTYEHSVGAFMIARDKIENALENGSIIKKGIEDEVGNIEIFYRACLFHDVGKTTIPKFILRNDLTDKDWAERFYKAMKKQKNKLCFTTKKYLKKYNIFHFADKIAYADSSNRILEILGEKKIRPAQVFPIKYGASKGELKRLKKDYNIDHDVSLKDLMHSHEKESYNILFLLGYKKEALIAGNHGHGGHTFSDNVSRAYSSMRVGSRMSDIVDLIYLADIQDSLGNDRYYHKSFTKLKIMAFLVDDVDRGIIDKTVGCLWVGDEFEKLKKDKKFQETVKSLDKNIDDLNEKELEIVKDLKLVKNFLESLCILEKK
ncbi:MAG: HD domain-containing protein [Patescibacteria group bacterium]|jgi:hypothetical protein|nr:HD domain-containing protein [Patescibacteria group bacterium]